MLINTYSARLIQVYMNYMFSPILIAFYDTEATSRV